MTIKRRIPPLIPSPYPLTPKYIRAHSCRRSGKALMTDALVAPKAVSPRFSGETQSKIKKNEKQSQFYRGTLEHSNNA